MRTGEPKRRDVRAPAGARFVVVASRYHHEVVTGLVRGCERALATCGVAAAAVQPVWVPGAFELPLAVQWAITGGPAGADGEAVDARVGESVEGGPLWLRDAPRPQAPAGVIALGLILRGATSHFEWIAAECTHGLAAVALRTDTPVGFGVLTADTLEQAWQRAGPGRDNKGYEAAMAVVEMAALRPGR